MLKPLCWILWQKIFPAITKCAEDVATPVYTRSRLHQVLAHEHGAVKLQRTQPYTPQPELRSAKKKIKRANQNTRKTPQYNWISRLNTDWNMNAIMLQRWSGLYIPRGSVFQQYFALNITVYYTCQPKTGGFVCLGFPPCRQWSKYLSYNNLYNWFLVTRQLAWVSFNAKTATKWNHVVNFPLACWKADFGFRMKKTRISCNSSTPK